MSHISKLEMTKAEWDAARLKGVGSSQIAAAIGLSEYQSPLDLYAEKVGEVAAFAGNKRTERGIDLEPILHQKLMEKHPDWKIQEDHKIRISKERPYAIVNLDRVLVGQEGGPFLIELKTTDQFIQKSWAEEVPLEYYSQVQWGLYVTGWKKGMLFVWLVDKWEGYELWIPRDDEYIARMLEKADKFWAAVEAKDPSGLEVRVSDIEKMSVKPGKAVTATEEIASAVEALREAKAKESEAKGKGEDLKDSLKAFMVDAEFLIDEKQNVLVTYKEVEKKAYSVAAKTYREMRLAKEVSGEKKKKK